MGLSIGERPVHRQATSYKTIANEPLINLNLHPPVVMMLMLKLMYSALLVFVYASAAPDGRPCACDLSQARLTFPEGSTLTAPNGPPKFVGLGVGLQNYTCTDAGAYTSAGAVATIYDISCVASSPTTVAEVSKLAIQVWKASPESDPRVVPEFVRKIVLGQHYFIANPVTGVGISPKWDFGRKGFVVAARVGGEAAPTGSQDIDWLALNAIQGDLASQIFRVYTHEGQPPASCTPGSGLLTVKYTSVYYLFA